jgi:hypothetical protein
VVSNTVCFRLSWSDILCLGWHCGIWSLSSYDLRQTSYIAVFVLLGDSPASEFCADISEHSVASSFEPNLYLCDTKL